MRQIFFSNTSYFFRFNSFPTHLWSPDFLPWLPFLISSIFFIFFSLKLTHLFEKILSSQVSSPSFFFLYNILSISYTCLLVLFIFLYSEPIASFCNSVHTLCFCSLFFSSFNIIFINFLSPLLLVYSNSSLLSPLFCFYSCPILSYVVIVITYHSDKNTCCNIITTCLMILWMELESSLMRVINTKIKNYTIYKFNNRGQ